MANSSADIDRIARLARLGLEDAEQERTHDEFLDILSYVEKIQPIATDDVPPTDHATGGSMVTRSDEVVPSENARELEARAPRGAFRVPSVRTLWTS